MRARGVVSILAILGLTASAAMAVRLSRDARAEDVPSTTSPREVLAFKEQVAPLIAKYCVKCHGAERPKGGVNLARFTDAASVAADRKTWTKVFENLDTGEMPPEGKPQPSEVEAELIKKWVQGQLSKADCKGSSDPGRVTLRRLNRAEYNNTIRDLVGIDFQPAADFPTDDVGYGFDNIGDVLSLPPLLMEKYLAAAESIAERAIAVPTSANVPTKRWEAEQIEGGQRFGDSAKILTSAGEVFTTHAFPKDGSYLMRARAFGQQAGGEPVKMAFLVDGKRLHLDEVKATEANPLVYEARLKLRSGTRRVAVAFLNDYYNPNDPDPKNRDRNLVVDYLEIKGPSGKSSQALPDSHKRILFTQPTKTNHGEVASKILERFANRAYRRRVTPEEVERLAQLVSAAEAEGESFERGIQLAVEAILISPNFLFRVELDPPAASNGKAAAITDHELASRLSYFLWSTMPDEELFSAARRGTLHEDANLEAQARRMLRDPKAQALVENFAGQWLQTRNIDRFRPDKERFPDFDEPLRAAMKTETHKFFAAIMAEDRSILDFLDADFTFVNERLAKHYGISGVSGEKFRRVSLTGTPRGGLLTQASVLAVTSNPTRTSPVKRGKWILEQILGTPPPPPPPDVPELKDDPKGMLTGTLRQKMEQHRANPSCASCHAKMDPIGFAFENFDAIGAWRDKDGDFPIDSSGTLPSGRSFNGPKELKVLVKSKEKEFTRCLTEKMLTYAIGRGLEFPDRCSVDRIAASLPKQGRKFSALVVEIVKSDPFRKRKGEGSTP